MDSPRLSFAETPYLAMTCSSLSGSLSGILKGFIFFRFLVHLVASLRSVSTESISLSGLPDLGPPFRLEYLLSRLLRFP